MSAININVRHENGCQRVIIEDEKGQTILEETIGLGPQSLNSFLKGLKIGIEMAKRTLISSAKKAGGLT